MASTILPHSAIDTLLVLSHSPMYLVLSSDDVMPYSKPEPIISPE